MRLLRLLSLSFSHHNQMIKFITKSRLQLFKISCLSFSELNKRPNLYTLLQLRQGASPQQIRYNYFKLMSKYKVDGTAAGDGLKHSRLLNQAYAILSNEKLREKYDKENGFTNKGKQNQGKSQKQVISKESEMDRDYGEAKRGISAVLGDKKTRLHQKILGAAAIGVFFGTLFLLFNGKNLKKQTLDKAAREKKE